MHIAILTFQGDDLRLLFLRRTGRRLGVILQHGLWLATLCVPGGIVGGTLALRGAGRTRAATVLVTIFAIPGALVGLLYLALLATPARWW